MRLLDLLRPQVIDDGRLVVDQRIEAGGTQDGLRAGDLEAFSGIDLRAKFLGWLYNGQEPSAAYSASTQPGEARKALDLNPPWIRKAER